MRFTTASWCEATASSSGVSLTTSLFSMMQVVRHRSPRRAISFRADC